MFQKLADHTAPDRAQPVAPRKLAHYLARATAPWGAYQISSTVGHVGHEASAGTS